MEEGEEAVVQVYDEADAEGEGGRDEPAARTGGEGCSAVSNMRVEWEEWERFLSNLTL